MLLCHHKADVIAKRVFVGYLLLKCFYNLHCAQVRRRDLPALWEFVFLIRLERWLSQHAMAC